jgi:hypothetical protein
MVYKKDSFQIEHFNITSNGFLDISGIVTRSGVFKYEDGGELRAASEVFRQDSLDTMFAIPVTWEHPPDLLNRETIPMYQKGFVASKATVEKYDDDRGVVKLSNIIIQDKSLIDEIVSNKIKQFSLGYSCDLDEKVGIFDDEEFVRLQKNIVYNHLAVVKDARCGDICSIIKKEDSMEKKEYKQDCACQSENRQDEKEKEKEESKNDESEDKPEEKESKKDESESEPEWVKKILSLLEKLVGGEKKDTSEEKPEEKESKKDDDDDDLYDAKKKDDDDDDMKKKKDKKKDSIHDTVSSFKFDSNSESRTDSTTEFKIYNRDEFARSLTKGVK